MADPHLLESGDPFGRPAPPPPPTHHWKGGCDLLLHGVSDAGETCGTTGQHSVGLQILKDVYVMVLLEVVSWILAERLEELL